ncbi:MAG: DUF3127 domain-containing protein [Mogibacterium sp.]|nr:DUF3127 domain-containing protein [Mogibacterium sp.]MBR6037000.1 DUF3127 domain-containing protein [Bacteroidaceae bacterium]MBR6590698.1 DUF3127 domain-containing protein [Bacteroidaceae bacterium]MBR6606307.1 DUF3127 domain-containing protein [Prevotella sp.]
MEQTGILLRKLDEHSGVSQRTGNAWRNAEFLMEVPGQYPQHINFTVTDGQSGRIAHFENHIGKTVTVSFDIDAHEYNGRWYNEVKAWGCKEYVAGQAAQQQAVQQTAPAASEAPAAPIEPSAVAEQTKLHLTQMAEDATSGEEGKEGEDDLPF